MWSKFAHYMDGQAVGVIGITREPEKVEPLGSVMKRITEILLREARTACLAARSDGGILFYNQVSLEFLARSIPPAIRQDLFQQVFGGCSEKEREELLETIWLYFRCDGQISRMAQTLYVHKNTCHYRLQRLKEKTGYSVHNPKESVLLCLCGLFAKLEES